MQNSSDSTRTSKVVSLFKFIKEISQLSQKEILNVTDYPWCNSLFSLPLDNNDYVKTDYVEIDDSNNEKHILLSIRKPVYSPCPQPNPILIEWFQSDWRDFTSEVVLKDKIVRKENGTDDLDGEVTSYIEFFTDDIKRVNLYNSWKQEHDTWAEEQKEKKRIVTFFTDLYNIKVELERNQEVNEFVIANGYILDKANSEINHPIITRRAKISFDGEHNIIYVEDTDAKSELCITVLQKIESINFLEVKKFNEEISQLDLNLLNEDSFARYLKTIISSLSAESMYSQEGIPDNWKDNNSILLYWNPCFIFRKRQNGVIKVIDEIINHIEETSEVCQPICDLVTGGKIENINEEEKLSVEEQLAAVGGESKDILLAKEANREQLEIARRIERFNAVLVQGPPGTGKTHTIANLMGHFLANGKKVLVTSQTSKALSVLKDKIVPGLQNLCVSLLDDNSQDMVKSVDGITEYSATNTSFNIKNKVNALIEERNNIIASLSDVRKRIFSILNKENQTISYNGESLAPIDLAKFVNSNRDRLSYIPGHVSIDSPLPLNIDELSALYKTNDNITESDEKEFLKDIPNPASLMSPSEFKGYINRLKNIQEKIVSYKTENNLHFHNDFIHKKIFLELSIGKFTLDYPNIDLIINLKDTLTKFVKVESWMKYCVVDGIKGGKYKELWIKLIEQIKYTNECAEATIGTSFGKDVKFIKDLNNNELWSELIKLKDKVRDGKISKFALLWDRKLKKAIESVTIDGSPIQNKEDCQLVIDILKLNKEKKQCAICWNSLVNKHSGPLFDELDSIEPERIAENYVSSIHFFLNWYETDYKTISENLESIGITCQNLFKRENNENDLKWVEKILNILNSEILKICHIFELVHEENIICFELEKTKNILEKDQRLYSDKCRKLVLSISEKDSVMYEQAYESLKDLFAKEQIKAQREEYIDKISVVAPQWASAIRDRLGVHGKSTVPDNIEDAWKWSQFSTILYNLLEDSLQNLQQKSLELSKEYRKITAELTVQQAWYFLLQRIEGDLSIRQALQGWKQSIKKIGKGTGKNASFYRAEAKRKIKQCQQAIAAWIMPINRVLESFDPKTSQFDIIIIDEASQANISALAVLFMGKKFIIVGDDKQVSPMAVGISSEHIKAFKDTYLTGVIPNADLYDAQTSIYDLASTTYQPLMLREHFRSVPDIIGFSNMLCYDYKIKPLRDSNSSLLFPAILDYRVDNGKREGNKKNVDEARTIVALMQACIEQPEYNGKSFGIISLLGDEQVKLIDKEIEASCISKKEIQERRILCGNASNFQGDERDVIFLSMVDSTNEEGPLSRKEFGKDDSYRKRYNVATSRAKDQLWVVYSLDPQNDLKPGDIRKTLIEYAQNPHNFENIKKKIDKLSDSPFESEVVSYLTLKGYHLEQQWRVGAYRIDIVAIYQNKKIAIECDGERYHSGEEKIREDMERQTILERLGWQFIRIMGSEYYSNPEITMKKVEESLKAYGIEPESTVSYQITGAEDTDLLKRIKNRAREILSQSNNKNEYYDEATISAALDPKNDRFLRAY